MQTYAVYGYYLNNKLSYQLIGIKKQVRSTSTVNMDTLHFSNHNYTWQSPTIKVVAAVGGLACFSFLLLSPNWQQALVFICLVIAVMTFAYFMLIKSRVTFTLTATHFQQHVFKGGWVVKWSNIERIGMCTHHQDGWHKPLPWIGIRLKHYEPYLDAICPRVATDLLLSQRALLYIGAQQTSPSLNFEDIVLDSEAYVTDSGKEYRGLLAMLANRMRYQREFHGFDVFVAEADLDRPAEEFVGLTRRYLAAADKEYP